MEAWVREWDRKMLSNYPPVALTTRLAMQTEPVKRKSLNMDTRIGEQRRSGVREHMQNWSDQCRILAGSFPLVLKKEASPEGSIFVAALRERHSGQLEFLGYMVEYTDQEDRAQSKTRTLIFKNYGSQMTFDMMTLGVSTKENDPNSAGYFGEGVKVEINSLLREEHTVHYRTGQVRWTFRHEKDGLGEIPVLTLISELQESFDDSTTMTIYGPDRGHPVADQDNYLFFSPKYHCFSCPCTTDSMVSGLELLPDARHVGRVYVRGILVMTDPNLKGFGMNYTGHGKSYERLGLTEARNHCHICLLVWLIPELLAHLKRKERLGNFVWRLYHLFETQPGSSICKHLAWDSYEAPGKKALVESLFKEFQKRHGSNAIPGCASEAAFATEAAFLGVEVTRVSEPLFKLFKKYNLLPPLEKLWKKCAVDILKMQDPSRRLHPDTLRLIESWKTELELLFSKWLQPGQIIYRDLPSGNQKVIISLPSHFVIDLKLLAEDTFVHGELGAACPDPEAAPGSCNCKRFLLVQSMMNAISCRPNGPSISTLQRHVLQQYQAITKKELQTLPPSPTTSIPVLSSGQTAGQVSQTSEDAASGSLSGPTTPNSVLSRSQSAGNSPTGQDTPSGSSGSGGAIIVIDAESDDDCGSGADPISHHVGLFDDIQKLLGSTTPAGHHVARSEGPGNGPGADDTVVLRVCKNKSREDLVRSSIYLGQQSGAGRSPSAYLYLPKGAAEANVPALKVLDLYYLLTMLHLLFSDASDAFQIYYGPNDGVIAFNRGDRLWYNAAYDNSTANPRARAEFWFLTICHELAHHYVKEHNSKFSDYASKLTLDYSQAFYTQFKL